MMAHARSLQRRSPKDWAIRLVVGSGIACLGYAAVTQSMAMALRASSPERAYRLAPLNGLIGGLWSRALSGPNATQADRAQSDAVARQALLRDPVAVDAVATLGINAQISGSTDAARQYFTYSQMLSRRDMQTQIWAIQDAGARGDIAAALKHYDIALRTSAAASNLYPALAYAIIDPVVRQKLVATLRRQPNWTHSFVNYVGRNIRDPEATARFFQSLIGVGVPVSDDATARIVSALINGEMIDQAWHYYASVRPGADRRRSRDREFSRNLEAPSSFDWTPINDGSVSASIQRGSNGGAFTFAAPSSIGGPVLQQMELLPPGEYVLEGRSEQINQPDGSRPYWSLICASGRELGRADVPNSTSEGGRFAGDFQVPGNCPVQLLRLNVRPSNEVSGVAGQIDSAELRPAR